MKYFFKVKVNHETMTFEELWDEWEKELEAAEGGLRSGVIHTVFKIVGQRGVLGVMEIDSHDLLDRMLMAQLPMAHVLEWEEILPIRDYDAFAADVRSRWAADSA